MTGQCFLLAFLTAVDCGDQDELGVVEKASIAGPPLMSYPEPALLQDTSLSVLSFTHKPLTIG